MITRGSKFFYAAAVVGFVTAIVYGFLAAIVFVPVYNYFQRREARTVEPIAAGQHGS